MEKIVLRKYKRGNGFKPCDNNLYNLEDALDCVNNGIAILKAQYDMESRLKINIIFKEDADYYYACRIPNMTTREFNKKYGKNYIDNFNFYL